MRTYIQSLLLNHLNTRSYAKSLFLIHPKVRPYVKPSFLNNLNIWPYTQSLNDLYIRTYVQSQNWPRRYINTLSSHFYVSQICPPFWTSPYFLITSYSVRKSLDSNTTFTGNTYRGFNDKTCLQKYYGKTGFSVFEFNFEDLLKWKHRGVSRL
jgi:hypothetical protein